MHEEKMCRKCNNIEMKRLERTSIIKALMSLSVLMQNIERGCELCVRYTILIYSSERAQIEMRTKDCMNFSFE